MYNVIILSDLHILNKTGAAFSRMYEYSKGLSKLNNVAVFMTSLLTRNNFNNPKEISTRVYITGEVSSRRKNFFLNNYFCFYRKKRELYLLIRHFKSVKTNCVILVYNFFRTFWEEIIFLYILKRNGFRVFTERNERSLGITLNTIQPKGLFKKVVFSLLILFEVINSLFKDESVRFYDGVVVISRRFEKWLYRRNRNYIRIPILAGSDINNDLRIHDKNSKIFRIGYSGFISFVRDGTDTLLEVMNQLINKQSANVSLTITGNGAKPTLILINKMIEEFQLSSKVKYLGYIKAEELLNVIAEQDMFIVLRRNNLQGRFSFATKIAEYMALGKLVLTTPVSDNSLYIKDNFNGFIIDNMNPEFIAQKIIKIINTPVERLSNIKDEARNTADNYFNIHKYSNDLFNFLFNEN